VDVFPTQYAMNTRPALRRLFAGHDVYIYGHEAVPTYFERYRTTWLLAALYGRLTPRRWAATLNVFVRTSQS
jgi:hypothetical protein